jgi:Fe2+ or Zn2+ uptake regulation protein
LEFDQIGNRYEGNINPHVNLVCKGCHRILDYSLPVSINPKEFLKKSKFWVTDTRLEYYGYCRECRKNEPISNVFSASRGLKLKV